MTQLASVLDERFMPLLLNAFDWRSSGRAFTYLPFMMDATSAAVAMLFLNRSTDLGALMMTPVFFFDAYT